MIDFRRGLATMASHQSARPEWLRLMRCRGRSQHTLKDGDACRSRNIDFISSTISEGIMYFFLQGVTPPPHVTVGDDGDAGRACWRFVRCGRECGTYSPFGQWGGCSIQ